MSGSDTKKCPFCAEDIKVEAVVCRFCGYDLRTGKPIPAVTSDVTVKAPKPRSTIADGVRIGFGMFIVLPILLFVGIIFLIGMCSTPKKAAIPAPKIAAEPALPAVQAVANQPSLDPAALAISRGFDALKRFGDTRKQTPNSQYDRVDGEIRDLISRGLVSEIRYDRVREFFIEPRRELTTAQLRDWQDLVKKAVRWLGVVHSVHVDEKDKRVYIRVKMDQATEAADLVLRVSEISETSAKKLLPGTVIDFLGFPFGEAPRERPMRLDDCSVIATNSIVSAK